MVSHNTYNNTYERTIELLARKLATDGGAKMLPCSHYNVVHCEAFDLNCLNAWKLFWGLDNVHAFVILINKNTDSY